MAFIGDHDESAIQFKRGFTHDVVQAEYHLHSHDYVELVWHVAGSGVDVLSDGSEQAFAAGAVAMHGAGCEHGQRNQHQGIDACLHVAVPAVIAEEIGELIVVPHLSESVLQQEFKSLTQNQISDLPQQILDARAQALVLQLLELHKVQGAELGSVDERLQQAEQYMRGHFRDIQGISEVAQRVSLSDDYFRHQFKQRYAIAPMEYILQCRLEHAKELLLHTSLGQEAIAQQCGFGNKRYFNTRFSHYVGMSPGRFRKQ